MGNETKVQFFGLQPNNTVEDAIRALSLVGRMVAEVGIFFDSPKDLIDAVGEDQVDTMYKVTFEKVETTK